MVFRSLTAGVFLATCALAQLTSFPKPSYFRETFAKTESRIELRPPARLQDFVVSDKLELSLRSYLELVMANNTDIQIQKLAVETPKNAILRAFGRFDPTAAAQFTTTRATQPASNVQDVGGTATELKTLS